jgi:hypothetical protein
MSRFTSRREALLAKLTQMAPLSLYRAAETNDRCGKGCSSTQGRPTRNTL